MGDDVDPERPLELVVAHPHRLGDPKAAAELYIALRAARLMNPDLTATP
ncbi:hypothetical protein [Nocardia amikacinitolerans]|nr:hypothetical protein [Nocardia amikacinitolerans]